MWWRLLLGVGGFWAATAVYIKVASSVALSERGHSALALGLGLVVSFAVVGR